MSYASKYLSFLCFPFLFLSTYYFYLGHFQTNYTVVWQKLQYWNSSSGQGDTCWRSLMGKFFVTKLDLLYVYSNCTFNTGNQINLCGNLGSWLTTRQSQELWFKALLVYRHGVIWWNTNSAHALNLIYKVNTTFFWGVTLFGMVGRYETASVVQWSEFLATDTVVSGSIPGATRFSEWQWVWNGVHSASWASWGQLRSYLN